MEVNESSSSDTSRHSGYVLNNANREAPARFDALSEIYDRGTIRLLEERGVDEGWHCLEVGGGGGSIALWLAGRVGSTGCVLVTDIDPRFLEPLNASNIEVRRHNIVTDNLPDAAFDLIHVRLVLIHLPEREKVLARLVKALKPGGWLVDEEFDSISLLPDPNVNPGEVFLKTQAAILRLMTDRGVETRCGRLMHGRMRTCGLADVGAEGRLLMWQTGTAGSGLLRANFAELGPALISGGYITEQELGRDIARLNDPDFVMPSPILWSAWGRRPSA